MLGVVGVPALKEAKSQILKNLLGTLPDMLKEFLLIWTEYLLFFLDQVLGSPLNNSGHVSALMTISRNLDLVGVVVVA